MCHRAAVAGRRRTSIVRSAFLVLALTLGYSGTASATPFVAGDFITYSQNSWGTGASTAGLLLTANYFTIYASTFGEVEVGIPGASGFSMIFSSPSAVISYLPAVGPTGVLTSDRFDPATTPSGAFGGYVLALRLNIDFSDAGLLGGPIGDLVLTNFNTLPQLNGLTVRQFSNEVNSLLGGGSGIYGIAQLDSITDDLTRAFESGTVSQFAQDHLVAPTTPVTPVPEPSTMLLLGTGLIGTVSRFRRRRSTSHR